MEMKSSLKWALAVALTSIPTMAVAGMVAPDSVKIEDGVIAMSVSGTAGNPEAGAKIFKSKKQGNCLACHANTAMKKQLFHGEVGPTLDGVADRWKPGEIRAILVNSKAVFGNETVMPGFYSLEVGKNPRKDLIGKTILSAQEIEDVVAYLGTLKE